MSTESYYSTNPGPYVELGSGSHTGTTYRGFFVLAEATVSVLTLDGTGLSTSAVFAAGAIVPLPFDSITIDTGKIAAYTIEAIGQLDREA